MANVPADLKYTREHEWAKREGDRVRVGITAFAQDQLGDVVFVDLPVVGRSVDQFATFGVVESVKAVSDLYAPVSGEVVDVNGNLAAKPELVNSDPFGEGRRQRQRTREPRLRRDLDEEVLDRGRADRAQHLALLGRGVRDVAARHQCPPPCATNSSYCCAVSSWSSSPAFEGLTRIIQPLP